jgi:hypothetical protein
MVSWQRRAGNDNPQSKLNEAQVRQIKARLAGGEGVRALAAEFQVGASTISDIKTGRRWSHVRLDSRLDAMLDDIASTLATEQHRAAIHEAFMLREKK